MNYALTSLSSVALLTVFGFWALPANEQSDDSGTVILTVVDADSGRPIEGVTFAIENLLAEIWAEPVGESDENGALKFESKVQQGYFYSVYPVPKGYKVTGLDAVPTGIKPKETVEHRFHLRKISVDGDVPDLIDCADLMRDKDGRFSTKTMPGFSGQIVYLWLDRPTAEYLYRNGRRLRAAIDDELSYFKKAEGSKAGDVSKIIDLKIVPTFTQSGASGWTAWCRTEGCIKLKQDGFKIAFDPEFEKWDLDIPAYLHPDF